MKSPPIGTGFLSRQGRRAGYSTARSGTIVGREIARRHLDIFTLQISVDRLSERAGLLIGANGSGGFFDELGRFLRARDVGHVARLHFDRLGIGALRHHALLVRID